MTEPRGLASVHALHQAAQVLGQPTTHAVFVVLHVLSLPLVWWRPRATMWLVAALGIAQCVLAFPRTGNHLFLGVVVSLLIALSDRDDDSLLAVVLLSFVWSGVHKVVHGLWFRGETLAWLMVSRADIAAVLRPFLSDGDAARLASLSRVNEGSGPFVLGGFWLVVSNVVWLGELAMGALWLPKLRRFARPVALVSVWAVQLVAHEWEFALLLTNMLVSSRRARIACAVGVVLLALLRLDVIPAPHWSMHSPEPT
ncbi:MAG: hypothetical protein ACO1OB_18825 [Archangium sp.]